MQRRFKYLTSKSSRKGDGFVSGLKVALQVCTAFVFGIVVGFNVRDILTANCANALRHHYVRDTVTQQIRQGLQSVNTEAASNSSITNATGLKPPKKRPVFKELPEKYLINVPRHKPAAVFSVEPWKYMEFLNGGNTRYFMTFLIKSACRLAERRFYVRQSWGSVQSINGHRFGIIFIVGMTRIKQQQELIERENAIYGDILQSDVSDNYYSLPTKVLASFQWVSYNLGDVSDYFVTTDDDCVINVAATYDYFVTDIEEKLEKMHCGYIYDRGHIPIRKIKFKWGVSQEAYSGDVYPAFCHGGMTIWPFHILSDIYRTSETTNYSGMQLEDVLTTGILRHKTYNSTEQIASSGSQPVRRVRPQQKEPMVWHLGLSKNLHYAFRLRWHRCKSFLRMGPGDRMVGKGPSAFKLNATVTKLVVLPNATANETVMYFVSEWSKFIKVNKAPKKEEIHETEEDLHEEEEEPVNGVILHDKESPDEDQHRPDTVEADKEETPDDVKHLVEIEPPEEEQSLRDGEPR